MYGVRPALPPQTVAVRTENRNLPYNLE